jgi:hypothetical protein
MWWGFHEKVYEEQFMALLTPNITERTDDTKQREPTTPNGYPEAFF